MPVKPTQYMLEHPLYPQNQKEEEKRESYGEVHCFLDRKNKKSDKKLKLQFDDEDMCNIQDSHSEISLNKTLEFATTNMHGSV
jgi:hypothetical protein